MAFVKYINSLLAFQTPAFNLAKFLVLILNSLTKIEYTIRNSFQFSEKMQLEPTLSLGNLKVI